MEFSVAQRIKGEKQFAYGKMNMKVYEKLLNSQNDLIKQGKVSTFVPKISSLSQAHI